MTWFEYAWQQEYIDHIAERDLTMDDVEYVMENHVEETVSRSSGRPLRFGYTVDGRYIAVVFEYIDDVTVLPITAYDVGEDV